MERPRMTHAADRLPIQEENRTQWSRAILCTLLAALVGLYAHWVVPDELALVITISAWAIVVFLIARLAIALIVAIDVSRTRRAIARQQLATESALTDKAAAEAKKAWREADVLVVTAKYDEQVFIRDEGHTEWLKAHLDARRYANGLPTDASPLEIAMWQIWQQSRQPRAQLAGKADPLQLQAGPSLELPSMVRWSEVVPGQRGNLNSLVLGLYFNEQGRLAPLTISLYDLFHTIAAGSTGWGKSAFVNGVLAQLATCPDPVEFVLIDQQDHGLSAFKGCDRLRYPLLRQPDEILSALHEIHQEATRYRSALFSRYDADDLGEYNRLADHYLPPIVVVVDEAASLLANKEISAQLKRHAWELRKFGVYQFLLLTSAKGSTIDTDHRQQFASKVQLHAGDRSQARLLIDAPEATTFPAGRAVIDLPGLPATVVQTPYLDKRELRWLLNPASRPPAPPPELVPEPDEPTGQQRQVLELWDGGERSISALAREVYGPGGRQEELVKSALIKFGRL